MLNTKGLVELSELLSNKETSSVEIAQDIITRIEATDSELKSFITFSPEKLLAQAQESDKRRSSGHELSPFDGIPIAVKDNINTSGIKTTCASRILENFVPPFDATTFKKMKEKGLLLAGKTNMDEFAMGSTTENSSFFPSKNPHNTGHVPGGSSGGSAVSVSSRQVPGALGSDTGGSIRQPAAFCGTVGVKPTYGRVSRYGLVAFASSLDQIGTFGNSVKDSAALLEIISGYDKKDSTSINTPVDFSASAISDDIKGMKIGVPEAYFNGVDEEVAERVREAIASLEENGAEIRPVNLHYIDYAVPVYYLIATAEASSNLARFDGIRYGRRSENHSDLNSLYLSSRSEGFGDEVKRRIILGTFSLSSGYYDAYYLKALKVRSLIINEFKEAFNEVDAIISPTTTSTAFKIGEMSQDPLEMYMSDILTISANLAGIPSLSVPVGLDSSHMPIGLQVMGNHFQEQTLFNCAAAVESCYETPLPGI